MVVRGPKFYGRVFGAQWQIWLWVTLSLRGLLVCLLGRLPEGRKMGILSSRDFASRPGLALVTKLETMIA